MAVGARVCLFGRFWRGRSEKLSWIGLALILSVGVGTGNGLENEMGSRLRLGLLETNGKSAGSESCHDYFFIP